MKFSARYFDGQRATAHEVSLTLNENEISFQLQDKHFVYKKNQYDIQTALVEVTRIIELEDGGRLEVADPSDQFSHHASTRYGEKIIYALENNFRYIALALTLTVLLIWSFISYGVPFIAEQVAHAIPLSTEKAMGEQVLQAMDVEEYVFQPSLLSVSRQEKIKSQLQYLCQQQTNCPPYKLLFRKSARIGANAFALPGGTLIITDDLVHLARDDNEITAVLAHELGHINRRHAMRQVLQSTLSGLVMVAVLGDFDSIASGLPATLLQLRYTRQMELEADAYALQALQNACISPMAFVNILERLSGAHKKDESEKSTTGVERLLASHPDTEIRLKAFRDAELISKRCPR
jgi:predicted Zn-dependent protease